MKYPAGLLKPNLPDELYYSLGAYVPQLKIKRKICVSIYRIQRIGVLLDDVRGHLAL